MVWIALETVGSIASHHLTLPEFHAVSHHLIHDAVVGS